MATAARKTPARRPTRAAGRRVHRRLDASHLAVLAIGATAGWSIATYGLQTVLATVITTTVAALGLLIAARALWKFGR